MDPMSFSDAEYRAKRKQTRREKFLAEIDKVIPWRRLEKPIEPFYRKTGGRRPYPLPVMLRVHRMQHWATVRWIACGKPLRIPRRVYGLSLNIHFG